MDFHLVLKRLPLTEDDKNNKSVATTTKPATTEEETQKTNEATGKPENNAKKKPRLSGLGNKVNGIIGKKI